VGSEYLFQHQERSSIGILKRYRLPLRKPVGVKNGSRSSF
jgi:hypothetical protein